MEFGNTIPLTILAMCCLFTVPFAGTVITIFIWFSLKDRLLARNIIVTVLTFGFLAFVFPWLQLIWYIPLIFQMPCCKSVVEFTPRMLLEMVSLLLRYGIGLIIPGVWLGFLVAFFIVLPFTLVIRHIKKEDTITNLTPLSDDNQSGIEND